LQGGQLYHKKFRSRQNFQLIWAIQTFLFFGLSQITVEGYHYGDAQERLKEPFVAGTRPDVRPN